MRLRDVALALLPPTLWAIAYTIAKPAMQNFPPMFLMAMVYALTALVLFRPWTKRQTPLWSLVVAATLGASLQALSSSAALPLSLRPWRS